LGIAGKLLSHRDKQQDTAGELFRGTYPQLAGWVRRQVDDDGTAHAIASEAFVRLLARWTKVEDPQRYLRATAAELIRAHESSLARVDDEVAA
jgi:RNA polymerase sigma-70 factor, ECF subfamily